MTTILDPRSQWSFRQWVPRWLQWLIVLSEQLATAQARIATLETTLRLLANEAHGFLSMANREAHGITNMNVLKLRIDMARAALAESPRCDSSEFLTDEELFEKAHQEKERGELIDLDEAIRKWSDGGTAEAASKLPSPSARVGLPSAPTSSVGPIPDQQPNNNIASPAAHKLAEPQSGEKGKV